MRVFLGQTRSRKLVARLMTLDYGEITQPYEWPPRRFPWVLDNGAFADWQAGRPFNAEAFEQACAWASGLPARSRPEWCVCPDRVATGTDSLAFSLNWLDRRGADYPGLRWYLAVQDGMTGEDVEPVLHRFAGIFVGGSSDWKVATGDAWVRWAHEHGVPCHIGRAGTIHKVGWTAHIGADSVDSCFPLWETERLDSFVDEVNGEPRQQVLIGR